MLAAPAWVAGALAQGAPAIRTTRLRDRLVVLAGAGGNVLVHSGDEEGLLVVDGGRASEAPALLEAIRGATGAERVALLLNTHWHREQTGLNESVGRAGGRILAHINTRKWLSVKVDRPWDEEVFEPLPEVARPTETFYHYGEFIHGATPVRYGYLRQAHTDGDLYVFLPEENVLHAGGVVSNAGWPLIDWWTGGSITGLAAAHDTLLAVADDDTVVVPADGPLMSKAELARMRDMYATLAERVREMFMAAYSAQDLVDARPAAEFEDKMGNADEFLRRAHESLVPHITPDA